MKADKESRQRLLECAKKEFLEKGFAKASLRKISADAGLTTGAVYFFFQDKNGLLGAIVEEPLKKITEALKKHFYEDEHEDFTTYEHVEGDHDDFAEMIIHLIYANYDAVLILLDKSQGSQYDGVVDDIIDTVEKSCMVMVQHYADSRQGKKLNEYAVHWLSHLSVNAFTHLITHEKDETKAIGYIKPIMDFLVGGWIRLALTDSDEK